jgi:hypothetical protein
MDRNCRSLLWRIDPTWNSLHFVFGFRLGLALPFPALAGACTSRALRNTAAGPREWHVLPGIPVLLIFATLLLRRGRLTVLKEHPLARKCRLCGWASTYARREQEKCEKTGGNDGNPRCSPQLLGSRIDPEMRDSHSSESLYCRRCFSSIYLNCSASGLMCPQ